MAKLTLKQKDELDRVRRARLLAKRILKVLEMHDSAALALITHDFAEGNFTVKDDLKSLSSALMFEEDYPDSPTLRVQR